MKSRKPIVCLDIGATTVRAGFAHEDRPRCCIQSLIGSSKSQIIRPGANNRDYYIGAEAKKYGEPAHVYNPFIKSEPTSKSDLDIVLSRIFENELKILPDQHYFITQEPLNCSKSARTLMTELLFEQYKVPGLFIGSSTLFSLYTTEQVTGISIDIGENFTQMAYFYERMTIPECITKLPLGGGAITAYLRRQYNRPQISVEEARKIKEEHCRVATAYEAQAVSAEDDSIFHLSETRSLSLGQERFKGPEILFNPSIAGITSPSIEEAIATSIQRCDSGLIPEYTKNIVLTGGTTLLKGLPERISSIFEDILGHPVTVTAQPNRNIGCWLGQSVMGSMQSFPDMAVSQEMYEELGIQIVNRRFYS